MVRLQQRFGAEFETLGPDEVQALVAADVEGEVTNQRLQEMLVLHRSDITRLLRGLVRRGLLVADGVGRGTRYFPLSDRAGIGPAARVASSPNSGQSSPDLDRSSPDLGQSSPDLAESSPDLLASPTITDLEPALLEIAQAVRGVGKAPSAVVRDTILRLCQGRFLTLRDLSLLLNRQPESLRDAYLRDLIRDGALELRFPDRPTHREQAYRTRA
jgi:ATP-dependent DNA helicase RecG